MPSSRLLSLALGLGLAAADAHAAEEEFLPDASLPGEADTEADDECSSPANGTDPGCTLALLQRRAAAAAVGADASVAPAFRAAPSGVNLGGWLVLEDWFFSGTSGRHVMSQDGAGQGACLPPLLTSSPEPWPSEGILTKRLQDSHGLEGTLQIFEGHRKSFITDIDFQQMAKLGIRSVRLPLPWSTFADALSPIDPGIYNAEAKIVPDPFYSEEAFFVTVDRELLRTLLQQAAGHGLKLVLDVHCMPGGSSDGTYSGIWPLPPKFWTGHATIGQSGVPLTQVGLWIVRAFVKWLESLGPEELSGLGGVTLLNEPAHMASVNKKLGKPFTQGEEQVLDWVSQATSVFRLSSLPGKGVKLYVNIVETAFDNFWETVPPWWSTAFTQEERHSWAVFDLHFYIAWSGWLCSGREVLGGRFLCSQPLDQIRGILGSCIESNMAKFDQKVDGLKACSEFSAGTFEDSLLACNGDNILNAYMEEQLSAFERFKIEGFFWTWRLPYGPNFERAWSYKHMAGLEAPALEKTLQGKEGMCRVKKT